MKKKPNARQKRILAAKAVKRANREQSRKSHAFEARNHRKNERKKFILSLQEKFKEEVLKRFEEESGKKNA